MDLREAVGIYGGSFNPPHNGHLRMAVQVREALGLSHVELVPTADHPLKDDATLADFAARAELTELLVADVDGLMVNRIESRLPSPSYTWRTFEALREERPGETFVFILGAEDLLKFELWEQPRRVAELAHLAVVGREDAGWPEVGDFTRSFWPQAAPSPDHKYAFSLPGGTTLVHVQAPRLDISASLIRELYAQGRSLAGLVPPAVEARIRTLAPPQWQD